jgi:predicted DNA-binding protein with PD1-like motif
LSATIIVGASGSAQTTENQFVRLTPEQLKWVPVADGVEVATLYGDLARRAQQ